MQIAGLGHAGLGHAELGQRDWDRCYKDSGTGTCGTGIAGLGHALQGQRDYSGNYTPAKTVYTVARSDVRGRSPDVKML